MPSRPAARVAARRAASGPTARPRRAAWIGAVAALAALVVPGACASLAPTPTAASGAPNAGAGGPAATASGGDCPVSAPVEVVAAENFWGSIAQQLGGRYAHVTSIVDRPG